MPVINVLLLTKDHEYSERVTKFLSARYSNIRVTSLDRISNISDVIRTASISVLLFGEEFSDAELPETPGTARGKLVSRRAVCSLSDKIFCKYSSVDELYRIILGLYAEVSLVSDDTDGRSRIFSFVSTNGGAGSTAVSAAFAENAARSGIKVLYLTLDKFESPIIGSDGDDEGCLSDLILSAIASGKTRINLPAKAASLIKTDPAGVSYIQGCRYPNDFDEMNKEMLEKVIGACISSAEYGCVVIDGSLSSELIRDYILKNTDRLVLVADGDLSAAKKLRRYIMWLRNLDQKLNKDIMSRTSIVINKGSITARDGMIDGTPIAGAVPRYNDNNIRSIASAISRLDLCGNIRSR